MQHKFDWVYWVAIGLACFFVAGYLVGVGVILPMIVGTSFDLTLFIVGVVMLAFSIFCFVKVIPVMKKLLYWE